MLKKLTQEQWTLILETGIREFAAQGMDRANINIIAKKAGISVGVLYKYFKDKEAFFLACLNQSLSILETVLRESLSGEHKLLERAEKIIRAVQKTSREHVDYINMYLSITTGSNRKFAPELAKRIEGMTAEVYAQFIKDAQKSGDIRQDIDPKLFAFFFDNLLMMLQFSYGCDYFQERFKVYAGDDIFSKDEVVVSEMLKFLESAFTLEQASIHHRS